MAKDCWCGFTFHLPGERHTHKKAMEQATNDMAAIAAAEKRTGKKKKKNGS